MYSLSRLTPLSWVIIMLLLCVGVKLKFDSNWAIVIVLVIIGALNRIIAFVNAHNKMVSMSYTGDYDTALRTIPNSIMYGGSPTAGIYYFLKNKSRWVLKDIGNDGMVLAKLYLSTTGEYVLHENLEFAKGYSVLSIIPAEDLKRFRDGMEEFGYDKAYKALSGEGKLSFVGREVSIYKASDFI